MDLLKSLRHWQRSNYFHDLVETGNDELFDSSGIPRLYVVVREDLLPPIHQGIQTAHAVLALVAQYPELAQSAAESYLILLGMNEPLVSLRPARVKYADFVDGGLVDPESGLPVHTARAFEPISVAKGNKLFGHLRRSE